MEAIDYEKAYQRILSHFNHITPFSAEEFAEISALSTIETVKKGTILYRQGTIPALGGFILRGSLRYFSTRPGSQREITTGFQFEDSCFGDLRSIFHNEPALTSLQAMEDTLIGRLDKKHYLHLFDNCKPFARVMMLSMEGKYNDLLGETIDRLDQEAEDRYMKLLEEYPQILQRVTQRYIASYLGVKPQSLSRIRRNITVRAQAA